MADEPMTLIDRLRNPAWCHSDVPFESPQLEKEQTVDDMREAAAHIQHLTDALRPFLDGVPLNEQSKLINKRYHGLNPIQVVVTKFQFAAARKTIPASPLPPNPEGEKP